MIIYEFKSKAEAKKQLEAVMKQNDLLYGGPKLLFGSSVVRMLRPPSNLIDDVTAALTLK